MSRNLLQVLLGGRVDWHRVGMEAGAPWQKDPPRWGPPLDPTHYARLGMDDDAMPGELALTLQKFEIQARDGALPPEIALAVEVLSDPLRKAAYDGYVLRERRRLASLQRQQLRWRRWLVGGLALVLAFLLIRWGLRTWGG